MNFEGRRDEPVRVFVDHNLDEDYHEWVTLGKRMRMNRRGVSNRRMWDTNWTKWVCNNPACDAWAVVSDDGVRTLLHAADNLGR